MRVEVVTSSTASEHALAEAVVRSGVLPHLGGTWVDPLRSPGRQRTVGVAFLVQTDSVGAAVDQALALTREALLAADVPIDDVSQVTVSGPH